MKKLCRIAVLMCLLACALSMGQLYGQSGIFDKIGIIVEHGRHGAVPEENLDLFTGNVTLRYLDISLPGPNGLDLQLWRVYNSKVIKDRIATDIAILQQEPYSWVGLGWTMHMGRVHGYLSDTPTIEFPDGRWETAYRNKYDTNYFITKDFLKYDKFDNKLYFKDGTVWTFGAVRTITYVDHTESVLLTTEIKNSYGHHIDITYSPGLPIITRITDSLGRNIDFFTDGNPTYPKLTHIDVKSAVGDTISYQYTVGTYPNGGYYKLTSFDPPELPAASFEYHSGQYNQFELTRVNTCLGGNVQYTYDSQTFYFYNQPLTNRVIKQKDVTFSAGSPIKTWTYIYPNYYNASSGTVTVQGPEFTSYVQYFGLYSNPAWKVGLMNQKSLSGGSLTETFTWLPQVITDTHWIILSTDMGPVTAPLLQIHTKTPIGDSASKEEYIYSDDLIKYGLPSRVNSYGNSFASYKNYKTMTYQFQSNETFRSQYMLSYLSNESIFSSTNALLKETNTAYYEMEEKLGAIDWIKRRRSSNKELTWDYTYSSTNPNFIAITIDHPGSLAGTETLEYSYGVLSRRSKPGYVEMERTISSDDSSILFETNQHEGTLGFSYDGLGRITAIDMPPGFADISATWTTNSVAISQGAHSVVKYWDGMGRDLGFTETGDGTTLYYKKTLDSESRVLTESKGSTNSTDLFSYIYNPAGQVTRITDPLDKRTNFAYSGTIMTVTDALLRPTLFTFNEMPGLVKNLRDAKLKNAVYSYDAIGRLLSVTYNNQRTQNFTYDFLDNILSENHPETGPISYVYSNENNLQDKTWAGTTLSYEYNASNQMTKLLAPDETLTYAYDSHGRVNRIYSSDGWERNSIAYNALGSVIAEIQVTPGLPSKALLYGYDGNNIPSTVTYPDGRLASFTNNGLDTPETLNFNGINLINQITYGANKQPTYLNIAGNGTEYVATYDAPGRLATALLRKAGNSLYQATFGYDDLGNIAGITSTAPAPVLNVTYTYDELYRLLTAVYSPSNVGRVNNFGYTYDEYGNLKTVKENGSPVFSKNFSVKNQIGDFTYDQRGNLTVANALGYSWDSQNRMTKFKEAGLTKGNYLYNERGLRLRAIPPAPEINIMQGTGNILDGSTVTFKAAVGSPVEKTFVVQNNGEANLVLSGTPIVTITGPDAAQFSVTQQPGTPVLPLQTSSFKIRFSPTSAGEKTAAIAIVNNDSGESPYDIALKGINPAPEMGIKQGSVTIADGDRVTLISSIGSHGDKAFIIENTGDANLILNGTPVITISGPDAGQFSVIQQPGTPIAPSGTTSFILRFAPTSEGTKTASIAISNNDANENPYDITLDGIIGYPEIDIWEAPNGGSFDFGTLMSGDTKFQNFDIENLGFADLQLTGTPTVLIRNDMGYGFFVEQQPDATIPSGEFRTFNVWFESHSAGQNLATLIIWNNDTDENPYEILLSGYVEHGPMGMKLVVDSPNGGERLASGSSKQIAWKGDESIKDVRIEYSVDNGSTFGKIVERIPNSGNYDWVVPYIASPSCLVRVADPDGLSCAPDNFSYGLLFKISSPEEALGPGSHLKMRLSAPDIRTQGLWFADIAFIPDGSESKERVIFNQIIADAGGLGRFLNKWHHIRVDYTMSSYMGSLWLDGALLFEGIPLQVGFPLSPSAEISLSSDKDARAEILIDDVELRMHDPGTLASSLDEASSVSVSVAKDSFEVYNAVDALVTGGWHIMQDVTADDLEQSMVTTQDSVSGTQALRLKALDGYSLSVSKTFSLPDRVPFDISNGNFSVMEAKATAVNEGNSADDVGLGAGRRGRSRIRERLERQRELMKRDSQLEPGQPIETVAEKNAQDPSGSPEGQTGILSVNPNGTYYIYGYDGKLMAEYDGLGACIRDYIYLGSKLFAEYRVQESRLYYYCSDQINSTRLITDETGTVAYSAAYDPYGGVQKTWGTPSYTPALKFSGKERDMESQLDYFGARYYANFYYRWLSVDPIINRQAALANPQLWNLYSFCHNNSVTYLDPDGREVIRYHDPKLQHLVEALAAKSKMIRDTMALYQGEGTPDLDIMYGDAGMEGGRKAVGDFDGPPVQDGYTGKWRLVKGKITIDTIIKKKGRTTKEVLRHEFGHADQDVRDPEKYDAEYKIGLSMKYDDRPLEINANNYASKSKKEKR